MSRLMRDVSPGTYVLNPDTFSRSRKGPAFAGLFRGSSRLVRLRHPTMTGQSCLWRLASAIGRCSLAGDSERPAPWNFCVPAADWESTAPVRCPAAPAPLRFVRGRSAAFVEQHSQPALLLVVRRASARRLDGNARFSTGATFLPRSLRVQLAWDCGSLGRLWARLRRRWSRVYRLFRSRSRPTAGQGIRFEIRS